MKKKIFGLILASGNGQRFGSLVPKQFHKIGDKTLLEISYEKFASVSGIEAIIVVTNENDINQVKAILPKAAIVVAGGNTRNESLLAGCKAASGGIVVSHDAARPFVDIKIIEQHCNLIYNYDFIGTSVAAVDTLILEKENGGYEYLNRDKVLHMQTPQTFESSFFIDNYKDLYTDALGIFIEKNARVKFVQGSMKNKKVTYPEDL